MISKATLKNLMLPIAMVGGAVFYKWMGYVTFLSPYLIFAMLTITYCRLDLRDLKPGRFDLCMLATQMTLAAVVLGILWWFSPTIAGGVFICVFIPTATAAPVITRMLGGSISKVATFSLAGNLFVAATGPLILAAIGEHPEMTFLQSFGLICSRVLPLLLGPIAVAFLLKAVWRKGHDYIAASQQASFYLWAISLFIVVGGCVSFVINVYSPKKVPTMVMLALGSLCVCLMQFKIGRMVGGKFGDRVAGGQGLGQKNTVLAVWLALAYLDPIASIAPSAYIAWQNIINSWQIMRHKSNVELK